MYGIRKHRKIVEIYFYKCTYFESLDIFLATNTEVWLLHHETDSGVFKRLANINARFLSNANNQF